MTPDMPLDAPPATPDPLAPAFVEEAAPAAPPLLELSLACPCGHTMIVGVTREEMNAPDARRFSVVATSHLGVMYARHLLTLAELGASYDKVPLNRRGPDFPTKNELLTEFANHEACPLRTAELIARNAAPDPADHAAMHAAELVADGAPAP